MLNDSGDSVTNIETALKSQSVATVVDAQNVGSGVGERDEKDPDKAVPRHLGAETQRSPSHPVSDLLPEVKYQGSPSPRGGPTPDGIREVSDAMLDRRGTEFEEAIESLASAIVGLSGELGQKITTVEDQQKGERGTPLGDPTPGAAATEQNSSVQEVPGSKSKKSEQITASSEHRVLIKTSATEADSGGFSSPPVKAHNSSILAEQTSSKESNNHLSSVIHDDLADSTSTSQLLSPNVHMYPSMAQPEFPKVAGSPAPSHSQTSVTSSVGILLLHSALAPIDVGAQHDSGKLLPIPTDNPPPMTAADMTDAILGLTFPFPPLEPPLPPQEEGRRIDAYVKLTFDDGNVYYIKNAAVVFGRAESSSQRRELDCDRGTRGPGESLRTVRRMPKRTSNSKKSKSTTSSASINYPRTPNNSRRTSIAMTTQTGLISSYDESARPFFTDPFTGNKPTGAPKSAPARMNEEALIHLPPTGEPARKNISRRHARLSFNVEKGAFELEVMGKNGAFVEDEWVERGSTWLLNKEGGHIEPSGEKAWRIQIGGVGFALMFPPRDPLENEESGVAAVGKEGQEGMSLAFLDGSEKEITTDFNEEDAEEEEEAEEGVSESGLEAEENSYVMAQSPEGLSENDSSGDKGSRLPVRGKSLINGYSVPYIEGDDEDDEDDEDGEDDDDDDADDDDDDDDDDGEENGELGAVDRVEEEEDGEDNEDEEVASSSDNSDDGDHGGDDYLDSQSRKRKRASQGKKPITRKNIKTLEALKRPKISHEQESRRGRGRPKKSPAGKAVASKGCNKGVPKKQPVPPQQNEREKEKERRKQEKERRLREIREREERDREERLRKLREEEKKHVKAEQKFAKREAKEQLQKERQLKKEQELKEILAQKKIDKAEKERKEKEQRLLERQEKLIREARDKETALQAKRRAREATERQSSKLCLPTISPSVASLSTPGSALPPLQLPTASSSTTAPADTPQGSPSRPSNYADSKEQTSTLNYNSYSQFTGNHSPEGFGALYHQRMDIPLSAHASTRYGYSSMKEQPLPKPLKEARPKKEKPPPKRKRSPSPPLNESDFPPEALLKPNASYLILIHEAISNSEKKMLSLPDIYRAIQKKYPYFKLRVTTTGWQSSVRHNLSQSSAFQKVQREGKGWLWRITEGFNIEKEKKKKLLPPPPPSQVIHPLHSHYGQMIANGVGSVPVLNYGAVRGQQPGLPLQNGIYMTNRPPGPPGPPVTTVGQSHHTLHGANVSTQYTTQPNQYQQAGQQSAALPNTQSNQTTTSVGIYTQGGALAISNSTPISRSTVPRAPIPPPPISNASRIQMAQLASQRPCEQRSSQVLSPGPPISSPVAAVKFTSIDTATLLAFDRVLADAEKNPPSSDGTSMQGVGYAQLRTLVKYALDPTSTEHEKSKQLLIGALQLMQKQKQQQQLKPVPNSTAGGTQTVVAPQKATIPQVSPGSTATKSQAMVNTLVPPSISTSAPLAIHSTPTPVLGISTPATGITSASTQLPSPARTPVTAVSAPVTAAIQTPVQLPQPANSPATTASAVATPLVSPQPPQPAVKPTPRATSQQLLNLLARLKAQKIVQQGHKGPVVNSNTTGDSADTLPPGIAQGVKRPLEQISTVAGGEGMEGVLAEGPVMKRIDMGLGQSVHAINQSGGTSTVSDKTAENSGSEIAPVVGKKEADAKPKISE